MLRSTRSRRLLRAALMAAPGPRTARDLLLGQQAVYPRARSRRGPPNLWKRRGSAFSSSRAALLTPPVELAAAEPQTAAATVLLERDGPRGGQLVERRNRDPQMN